MNPSPSPSPSPASASAAAAAAAAVAADGGEVEQARRRCLYLRDLIARSLPSSKISPPCRLTLLRLIDAELRFLSRLPSRPTHPVNPNVGYLESLVRIIQLPSVRHVSRVCKPVPHPAGPVHVDVVCTLGRSPAWILVSDRNPRHISWSGPPCGTHWGLRARVERVLAAARSALALSPASLRLVFSRGLGDDTAGRLVGEFGAVEVDLTEDPHVFEEMEEGWIGITPMLENARVFEIKVDSDCGDRAPAPPGVLDYRDELGSRDDAFGSLLSSMGARDLELTEMINFDTTALVAMVSGISNGGTERLLKASEVEMRQRFKSNYEFVVAQVTSEIHHPILAELEAVISGKKGIICENVCSEFSELVLMCGGPNEKLRADQLVERLLVVPNSPSARVMDLPTTRKIASKNKTVFGTGDYWRAPTLTANMGFVRAVSQTGMSLLTIEHRPRALTGD